MRIFLGLTLWLAKRVATGAESRGRGENEQEAAVGDTTRAQ